MNTIVITDSTRGLGFALAEAFLARGCAVVLCGRTQSAVDAAVTRLAARFPADSILGLPCDVADFAQVQALWDAAVARFGRIDIWINNAGLGNTMLPFWQQPPATLAAVLNTNLLGSLYGSRVALAGMIAQGGGALYNMEGFGSDGSTRPGLTPYATTKSAIRYLTHALVAEAKGTRAQVGAISPGMLATDLLLTNLAPGQEQSARRIFNILADKVETVAPWLVDRILANNKTGARIAWLTKRKIYARFAAAPFRNRHVIE